MYRQREGRERGRERENTEKNTEQTQRAHIQSIQSRADIQKHREQTEVKPVCKSKCVREPSEGEI